MTGFSKNHNTTNALIKFPDDILKAMICLEIPELLGSYTVSNGIIT